ncbi:MAG TPA: acetoin dehydrogenase dihydrolipoyllysine-residue acetyltransferase subunit [Geminicoccus sp.]|jgi:pyruvate dehydrogenase E2 component (dihydrolipoamide acetyltransferase)|uniref:acetoin dehydrogenase dihydrolipoyllysine-residue acetyltransferase subunit n=1 Tax=Geminicoccus sp. TaxID=2024832 RepID=UPI002E327254|nr:acetoin dehydrogenase dihydrolipoyllysine-residue acetyltransferase subunit [Geminicoccus sp.]HEX2529288.1 acetoin dehydrogenase dihydrolipoyllysine-residue acetyltransferase subunit [Geminicoccus sp.]
MAEIQTIVMPKWGLAMQEGMLAAWHVEEGASVTKGQEIADIETSKIANAFESPISGKVRKILVSGGETVPVGALLAVVADDSVGEAEISSFVEDFQAKFAEQLAASAADKGPEPETIDVGGQRIRYLAIGDGSGAPVVLIHGYGGDLNNFLFNQPPLSEKHTTYAIDLPGHGGSTKDVGEGSVEAMAKVVLGFLDAKSIAKAHLVGHSMGGAVSLYLALNHPDRVASATLLAPAGLGPDISMEYINGFIEASRRKKLEPILQMLVAKPEMVTGDMVEDVLKFKRLDGVDAALKKVRDTIFAGGSQKLQLRDQLGSASVPIQVIWGTQDKIVPSKHGQGLPGSIKVTTFDDAGHLIHMEKSAEVNEAILAFTSAS